MLMLDLSVCTGVIRGMLRRLLRRNRRTAHFGWIPKVNTRASYNNEGRNSYLESAAGCAALLQHLRPGERAAMQVTLVAMVGVEQPGAQLLETAVL